MKPGVHLSLSHRLSPRAVGWLGYTCVFASAICFYFATAVIRWAAAETVIDASYFSFFRFLLGFLVISTVMVIRRQGPVPRKYSLLLGRAVYNCIAVYCFYKAVETTSVAEGNIMNMTYPVFLTVFSWFFLKEQRDIPMIAMVVIAFAGIWLILSPGLKTPTTSLWGVASGITSALAILYLNLSRQYHDSETVLFYMFGIGCVIMYGVFHEKIFLPDKNEFYFLMICSLFGTAGQYLLTFGFRYVTAVEGSVISSSRILMAAILGPWVAGDPVLSVGGWIGALLIFFANVMLTLRRHGKEQP
ncbi:MAG: DMT family transporter [Thermodesulfobacteriota bacterium]